ncbi:MAG: MATE family efflux transporter [Oscillospiraceae bacterium]|nr:MATE family efflux transporter [Oscillospiraceae bacterium]
MKTEIKPMTDGSELRHILRFTLPLLAGNLFQQLYNIVDSVIVGKHLGYNALAAVGATGSVTYFFYTLCIGLAVGIGILIAQSFGGGRLDDVKKLIANSAYVLGGFGIIVSIASALAAPMLLKMLGTPDSIFDTAVGYMRISCAGTAAVAAYNWINAVLRSLGDSKTPLIFLIIASILNVVLDILFVMVLEMGANGAAWATITAQGISAAGSIIFAFYKNPCFSLARTDAVPNNEIMAKCIRTGTPIALQNAMVSVSMIYLQRTANRFGDTVIAAYTATMRVEQLIQQPFSSLSSAVSTFAGQNTGAGKHDRVIKGYKGSMKTSAVFAVVMLAVFMAFSPVIIGFFVDEPEVIAIGASALRLSACFYIFLGTIHTTRGLLNGTGDVGYALINGIAEVIGRIGFALILVQISAVGYFAVWGTTCLTWLLTAVMSLMRYKSRFPHNSPKAEL